MSDLEPFFELLQEAEDNDQLACARVIYEAILAEEPEQGALLVLYAANLIELGDLPGAEAIIARAEVFIDEDSSAGLLTQRGNLARARGQFADAEKYYRGAHKIDPDDPENLLNAAAMATGQGELAKAEYLLREAAKVEGDLQNDALYNLGGNLVAQQRYDEAQQQYEKLMKLDPEHTLAVEWIDDLDDRRNFLAEFSHLEE